MSAVHSHVLVSGETLIFFDTTSDVVISKCGADVISGGEAAALVQEDERVRVGLAQQVSA